FHMFLTPGPKDPAYTVRVVLSAQCRPGLQTRRTRLGQQHKAFHPILRHSPHSKGGNVTLISRFASTIVAIAAATACGTPSAPAATSQPASATAPAARNSHQDWPTGDYKVVDGWPKPLPDTRHSHAGWTWGSFGGVYAENPDRIWVAMRGELPLPKDAAPWTPYAALQPTRGNATGNSDGLTATCQPEPKRGWERRFQHSIIVFNQQGDLIDEWPHLDEMFSKNPCGRGPHQIK